MEIKVKKLGEGRDSHTTLSWKFNGKQVLLEFPTVARPTYSEPTNQVYVSEYLQSSIYVYTQDGELLETIKIPKMAGYQFRGLNRNKKSRTGISLLYAPTDKHLGNEWKDIEQYELTDERPYLGDFIDIYR